MKRNKSRKNLRWIIFPLIAVTTFLLTRLAAKNPEVVEKLYSRGVYPAVAYLLSFFSSLFPFSLDDLFYIVLILSPVLLILAVILKYISWKSSLKIAINIPAIIYTAFYFLWGFNYFRADFNTRLQIPVQIHNIPAFTDAFEKLAKQLNSTQTDFTGISKSEIDSLTELSFKKHASLLNLKYPAGKRKPKEITFSRFFAKAGISGYYGPFFNEVHVNRHNLPVEYPFVLAHEKAHQFGITGEAEANFYAWLICTESDSQHLKYSANLAILGYFLAHGRNLKQTAEITGKLDAKVKADYNSVREHHALLRNEKIDKAASKVNDAYLKTNKIEDGIMDYTGVVKHILDYSAVNR